MGYCLNLRSTTGVSTTKESDIRGQRGMATYNGLRGGGGGVQTGLQLSGEKETFLLISIPGRDATYIYNIVDISAKVC